MNIRKNRLPLFPGLALAVILGAGLLTMVLPGQAGAAGTAANAKISNTAIVNYDDEFDNPLPPVSSPPCIITVTLVVVAPTLTVNATTGTTPSTAAKAYTYTLTNKSNGPDTFTLTRSAFNIHADITLAGGDPVLSVATYTLGATSVAAAALTGVFTITVPNDGVGAGGDTVVNGIQAGDKVLIGANTYTVASTVDNAGGTSTITFTTALLADVAVGDQVGEQGTFTSTTTPTATSDGKTYDINATATSDTTPAQTATSATTTTTVTLAVLTVTKFVRNITDASTCSTGTVLAAFNTGLGAGAGAYCTTGVTGKTGEVLEYVIRITNGGSTLAKNVIISDAIPAFTTKVADQIALGAASGSFVATGTDAVDTDFAKLVGSATTGTVYIYAGTGGNDTTGVGGTLAAAALSYGAFQVTID